MNRHSFPMIAITFILISSWFSQTYFLSEASSGLPGYEKWGQLAVLETKKRYPDASVVDYLYIGRTEISQTTYEERFKLWLRKSSGNEFGVFVTIQVNKATDSMEKINFEETDRGFT